jgi:putative cardiolipin synthase
VDSLLIQAPTTDYSLTGGGRFMRILHMVPRRCLFFLALCVCGYLLSGCATLPVDYPRQMSTAFDRTEETTLTKNLGHLSEAHPGKSGFYVLDNGLAAFLARAALIEGAGKTIDLQYYIIHLDLTGKLLMGFLLKAADRGVRVRLLVDDMYSGGKDFDAAAFSAHPNIEVRLFNPYAGRSSFSRIFDYITDFSRVQRRMHNKMFIVDGVAAVVGGRNLGDEYFAAKEDVNFADADLLALGPVVHECGVEFDKYWNSDLAFPIEAFVSDPRTDAHLKDVSAVLLSHIEAEKESVYAQRLSKTDLLRQLKEKNLPVTWAPAKLSYDLPEKITSHGKPEDGITLWPRLVPYLQDLKSELILVSPYFVPGDSGVAHIKALGNRGVNVRILTNSLASNDVSLVHGGYARYREAMLRSGVELYEVRATPDMQRGRRSRERFGSAGASLHAKTFVFDRKVLFVGSANLDPRSRYLNTEVGMIVESPELAGRFASGFDSLVSPDFCFRVELEKTEAVPGEPAAEGEMIWIGEEEGKEVIYRDEPFAGFWKKLSTKILSLFAPESML